MKLLVETIDPETVATNLLRFDRTSEAGEHFPQSIHLAETSSWKV
ncbi:hypothetical protein [Rubripirellula lacrimiformis]|nr:hypothetical protein [Rubripirellula lacrimiformis]